VSLIECNDRAAEIEHLESQAADLIADSRSPDESRTTNNQLQALKASWNNLLRIINTKNVVVSNWMRLSDVSKRTKDGISILQRRVDVQDPGPDELDALQVEINLLLDELVKFSPASKNQSAHANIDPTTSISVKDRFSERILNISDELDNLRKLIEKVDEMLQRKKEKQTNLASTWSNLGQIKSSLLISLLGIQNRVENLICQNSSLDGIQLLERTLEELKLTQSSLNPQYDEFRKLGQQIILADKIRLGQILEEVNCVDTAWQTLEKVFAERLSILVTASELWMLYINGNSEVLSILKSINMVASEDFNATSGDKLQQLLDDLKVTDAF